MAYFILLPMKLTTLEHKITRVNTVMSKNILKFY